MSPLKTKVSADAYLRGLLSREAVDISLRSPLRTLEADIFDLCHGFAGRRLLEVYPGGAFEKGTANASGIAIDFVASFSPLATEPMQALYEGLFAELAAQGWDPVRRDVSIAMMVGDLAVDIIPARRESLSTDTHELWLDRQQRALKTNLGQHVLDTISSGHRDEIRVLKLWRDQNGLDFPSFYLELSVAAALRKRPVAGLAENVWAIFGYLETLFPARSVVDPASPLNVVSDQLKAPGREAVRRAAQEARAGRAWSEIIR